MRDCLKCVKERRFNFICVFVYTFPIGLKYHVTELIRYMIRFFLVPQIEFAECHLLACSYLHFSKFLSSFAINRTHLVCEYDMVYL